MEEVLQIWKLCLLFSFRLTAFNNITFIYWDANCLAMNVVYVTNVKVINWWVSSISTKVKKRKSKRDIPGGTRTRDLWIRSPSRYPLRYGDHFYRTTIRPWCPKEFWIHGAYKFNDTPYCCYVGHWSRKMLIARCSITDKLLTEMLCLLQSDENFTQFCAEQEQLHYYLFCFSNVEEVLKIINWFCSFLLRFTALYYSTF